MLAHEVVCGGAGGQQLSRVGAAAADIARALQPFARGMHLFSSSAHKLQLFATYVSAGCATYVSAGCAALIGTNSACSHS